MNRIKNQVPFVALLALLLSLTLPRAARADALVVTRAMKADTIAEFFVDESGVRVELEIGIADLDAFLNLLPDPLYEKVVGSASPFAERLPRFFERDFVIRADGEPLPGRVEAMDGRPRIVRDEITGEPIPLEEDEEPEAVVVATLRFPFEGKPDRLSFAPPTTGDSRTPAANIGFVAYHDGLPVNDFRYLGAQAILYLDWDDPWYSKFRNPNLRRKFAQPIQGFLYVEPYEVRKEIVVRPRDLEHWIDLGGLAEKETLTPDDRTAIVEKVAAFLDKRCPVTIDGRPVKMNLDRMNFIRRTLRTTMVVGPDEDLPAVEATLGAIYVTTTEGYPDKVTMMWDLFTPRIDSMFGSTTDQAGSLPSQVTPDFPELEWKNYLKNPVLPSFVEIAPPPGPPTFQLPVLSTLFGLFFLIPFRAMMVSRLAVTTGTKALAIVSLAGMILCWPVARIELHRPFTNPQPLAEAEASDLVLGLLKNTYRAFDYREEGTIYDTLDRSVSGDLLTKVYLEIRDALELQNQGGARAKVSAVELEGADSKKLDGGPAFTADCVWTVAGSVGHWGHIHQRVNRYRAALTVEPVDDSWKITGLELLEEERL